MTSTATVTFRNALIALLASICAVAILAAGDAQAAVTHPYTGISFGPSGVGSGSFLRVNSVTIDPRSGDVFVRDEHRLYKFDAGGEPVDFSSTGTNVIEDVGGGNEVAVDGSTGPDAGDIYADAEGKVRIFSESGKYLGSLGDNESCGVAVDQSGNVYVGEHQVIRRYAPSTNPVTDANEKSSMGVGDLSNVCNVAVDGAGDVFGANNYPYSGVYEYEALQFGSLAATGTLVDSSGATLAVDPLSDELFIHGERSIQQYDTSVQPPSLQGSTGEEGAAGELSYNSSGVAINHETGELYVGDTNRVEIFGAPVEVPGAITEKARSLTASQATLHGTVEPAEAEVTSCAFEYHDESSHGSLPCEPGPPYAGSSVQVSAVASGLRPGTTYQYRIIAVTSRGTYTGNEVSFTTAGPRIEGERSEGVGSKTATLSAGIVAGEEPTVHYYVEYGTSASYGKSTAPVEVKGEEESAKILVGGLDSKTTYHFRFVAENTTATTYGPDLTFTTGNVLSNESFSQVSSEAAVLGAEIDPGGVQASYVVEYGSSSSYGSSTAPVSIGAGEGRVAVAARLSGLHPGAAYHFRFVVSNESEVNSGEDLSFTTHTLSYPGLPDGRGYEMVTPVDNQGAESYAPLDDDFNEEDAIYSVDPFAAAADGDAVSYVGSPTSSGNGSQGNGGGNQYLARRAAHGEWVQTDIQPAGYATPRYWGFSKDLQHAVLSSSEPIEGRGVPGYEGLYVRDETNSYSPLSSVKPPNRLPTRFGAAMADGYVEPIGELYAGASADFTHLLFEANDALTDNAEDPEREYNNLYESVEGQLRSVNVLPDGAAAPNASFGAAELESASPVDFSHVISSDGSRIFWTDMNTGALYVREDGSRTSLIAEDARYLTASSDGSKVIYTKGSDLYEEDLQSGVTEDLEPGAEMVGILGASEDLSYIYFVAHGVLAAGGESGQNNLYLFRNGETRYIAKFGTVVEEEVPGETLYPQNGISSVDLPWESDVGRRTAEVTPSGEDVVFMSTQSLTGYDNIGPEGRVVEVYVYDAENGALSCASCDTTGEPPTTVAGQFTAGGFFAISGYPTYQLHVISDDGGRVFFESRQPLLPQANDQKLNVYEWERNGSGSCQDSNGCVYLLSTGSSPASSYFIDASSSGNDVFLMTRSELVEGDKNEYNDIYDAHVGAVEPAASPRCTGTGCQGVPAAPPVFATPSSVTFNGVGNLATSAPKAKPKTKTKAKAKIGKKQCTVKAARRTRGAAEKKRVKAVGCQRKKTVRNTHEKVKKGSAR